MSQFSEYSQVSDIEPGLIDEAIDAIHDMSLDENNTPVDPPRNSTPLEFVAADYDPSAIVIEGDNNISDPEQNESSQEKTFRKIPELREAFERVDHDKEARRSHYRCRGCMVVLKTNKTSRLLSHVKSCDRLAIELRDKLGEIQESFPVVFRSAQKAKNLKLNLLWAEMLISNNIALAFSECNFLKRLLVDIGSEWFPPPRHDTSFKYIPKLSRLAEEKFNRTLETFDDFQLSIEFDHWQDNVRRSILGVITTLLDGSRYLITLEDVSLKGHSLLPYWIL